MCKKNNLSLVLNKTLKLFNDRLKIGDDTGKSELYYKKLLLEHGAYILINIKTGYVWAAGVMDNGYKFFSKPWSKIDVIACRKYRQGHGSLLMKHMIDAADGETIFVYAVTDRNPNTIDISNQGKRKNDDNTNRKDTIPFYEKYGFETDSQFLLDHEKFMPNGTFPMIATKNRYKID